eukprot:TRINITY_DN46_c0_g2_i1.p1 TRINITY_DN46_c0_g2~~TRINITY_DN46_c0_g2_i1.p1  ORF type:complete len:129 (+),score=35.89 TRINITY_DN46_c0_g2_i1:79-465(+)
MGYGGYGKGWGNGWGGGGNVLGAVMQLLSGGKGKGKGKGKRFIKTVHFSKKVWIGGFAVGTKSTKDMNKELQTHMSKAGKCTYAEISEKGCAVASFQTEDEATNAVAMMNGSRFQGIVLQVDTWTKKE